MHRKTKLILILLAWTLFPGSGPLFALNPSEQAGKESLQGTPELDERELLARADIREHSISRHQRPKSLDLQTTWITEQGLVPQSQALVNRIQEAELEGLSPDRYDFPLINEFLLEMQEAEEARMPVQAERLTKIDSLLSEAFLAFGSHLVKGQVDPETVHEKYDIKPWMDSLSEVIETALEKKKVEEALEKYRPKSADYVMLKQALGKYREILGKGGWPEIPEGASLRNGDHDTRVALLCSRLIASGDLESDSGPEDLSLFGDELDKAVRGFQQRHGCRADGIVGDQTRTALNVPVEQRIRQIELNLERWRWLPRNLGDRYILVNTASFELKVMEKAKQVMSMRVIAGKKRRPTPMLSGTVTYLVLNPYWNIPHKIAVKDLLPKIKKDPEYLARENIRVFESWEANAAELDTESIDWDRITKHSFSYKLRQDPGPRNALGRVKLMFPNKFAVYLHDTPSRHLFRKEVRDFSSGCVRIEKPMEMLNYLFQDDPTWTQESILAEIEKRERRIITFPKPIPVYLLYWTAWTDEEGTVHFRDDHYGRDHSLERALRETPPDSGKG